MTVPAEIRRHLGLKRNDRVAFVIEPEGTVRLRTPRYSSVASLRGAAGSLKEPLQWEQALDIAREDHLREKYEGRA